MLFCFIAKYLRGWKQSLLKLKTQPRFCPTSLSLSMVLGYFYCKLYQCTQCTRQGIVRGSITVPLTSCLTGLDLSVLQIKTKIVSRHAADSKPVIQEVNDTVIPPLLVFPAPGQKNFIVNAPKVQR
jgi:hypothetical protein